MESPPNDTVFSFLYVCMYVCMYATSFLSATFHDLYAQISVLFPKCGYLLRYIFQTRFGKSWCLPRVKFDSLASRVWLISKVKKNKRCSCTRYEDIMGGKRCCLTDSYTVLDRRQWLNSRPLHLNSGGRVPGVYRLGGTMGPRTDLQVLEKRNISCSC